MRQEAKANEAADREARAKVDKLNEADGLIFQTEKQLKEFGDKLPADKKQAIEDALTKLKAAHQAQDVAGIEVALPELNNAWSAASQDLYNATQGQGNPSEDGQQQQSSSGEGTGDTVTDAEFEEVK